MKPTLTNPTDDQLDAAVAEYVAGLNPPFSIEKEYEEKSGPDGYSDFFNVMRDAEGNRIPRFSRSADAVLPLIEKASKHRVMFIDTIWYDKMGNYWTVEAHKPGNPIGSIFSTSGVLAHALCIALLQAHGVQVEFTPPEK